jgi:hypothetical protein
MPGGRPTVMTKEVLAKLEYAFSANCNKTEACLYAGISHDSLDRYIEKNPKFSVRIQQLRSNPRLQAKINTIEKLEGDKCQRTAEFILTHTDPDYMPKQKNEVEVSAHKSLIDAILAAKGK